MDHALRMERAERGQHLARQAQSLGHRERPALQPLGQRLAFEQLHRDEEPPRVLTDLEDLARVRMADAGGRARLATEAPAALVVGVRDGLERDAPAQGRILGRVDDAHASASQRVQDAIAADAVGSDPSLVTVAAGARKPPSRRSSQPTRRKRVGVGGSAGSSRGSDMKSNP